MPFLKRKKTKNYTYGIWKITENIDYLLENLNPSHKELIHINQITHPKRKKQNISARLILNILSNKKTYINYNVNGAPSCVNYNYISISHSHNYCIVITSNQPTGVDIQYQKSNIQKLSKRFINSDELIHNYQSTNELHFIWCAKEAIYKTINTCSISLKENIYIQPVNKKMTATGYYKNQEVIIDYQINYKQFKNYFIAIAIKLV
ncbi:MAG: hypothetical protein CMP49_00985 [Flavobacteriales bacterium]|jgi:4'-phosphopantetheinyl transferase|nr:hypothetical protein [Flavobacteriales bacterium]|tara:strand:+ start:156 stop:773 length:618 start_codon:yes stop_codon:yes gene_type:complete